MARKTSQPKKALNTSKSDEPISGFVDTGLDEDEKKSKKASRPGVAKKSATKARKKVKKTSQPKQAPKSPEFIDSSKEE